MSFLKRLIITLLLSTTSLLQAEATALTPVSPTEDLMNEHGILNRILLIYDEVIRRVKMQKPFDPQSVSTAVDIVQEFIHEYHEKNEEKYIFPLFNDDKKIKSITDILIKQHTEGGKVTQAIQKLLVQQDLDTPRNKKQLAKLLKKFIKMYRPHEAREDTVVFPAVHAKLKPEEFAKLSDIFEDTEREKFGEEGFETILAKIVKIEKELGIYDLAQFTPQLVMRKQEENTSLKHILLCNS